MGITTRTTDAYRDPVPKAGGIVWAYSTAQVVLHVKDARVISDENELARLEFGNDIEMHHNSIIRMASHPEAPVLRYVCDHSL